MTLLSVSHLSVAFNETPVVQDSSFTLAKGEILALVGESGSGKSMTALACLGLQPAAAHIGGSIQFAGQELAGASEITWQKLRGNRIGMIFQEPMTALNPLHTISRQIGEVILIHNVVKEKPAIIKERVMALLEQVGLGHFKDRLNAYPHQLSGGERQRVMIAMAIANKPELLIADEPTTAVDVTVQAKILGLLKELQQSMGMAILFITHDLTIVRKFAGHVAVMSQGAIVERGKVSEIFANPHHAYTKRLLNAAPEGEASVAKSDGEIILACEHVRVAYSIKKGLFSRAGAHTTALEDVSFSLARGTTLSIVGESGSGKTTLGLAILRLIKSQGHIVFMGNAIETLNIRQLKPMRKHMQIVFQDPYSSLNPRMNVRQLIEEGLLVHYPALTSAERAVRIDRVLQEVGLSADMKERYPHEFSGGQRQRLSIARAMALNPAFVVLDEPTSALDLVMQSQIIELLKDFQLKYGTSYLFISHDVRVVKAIAQQVIILHKGRIVEYGDTRTIFAQPQHPYTKALIQAAFMDSAPG